MPMPEPLAVGDVERPATVGVEFDALQLDDGRVSVVEEVREGEPPAVKLEVGGPWGEVVAILSSADARDVRDRLDEVLAICGDVESRPRGGEP